MARQNRPQLFDFEVPSSENLSYIPLSVRFHLDRTGLRISLDDWQRLPIDARTTLASYSVDEEASPNGASAAPAAASLETSTEASTETSAEASAEPSLDDAADQRADDTQADDFAALLRAWMLEHTGHGPQIEAPLVPLPGADRSALPASVARQCEMAALAPPSDERWASLSRFQRYALAKLSRKDKPNHDFVPAMTEFGLIHIGG